MADGGSEFRGVVGEGDIVEWTLEVCQCTKTGVVGPPDQVVIGYIDGRGGTRGREWDVSYVQERCGSEGVGLTR